MKKSWKIIWKSHYYILSLWCGKDSIYTYMNK